MSYFPLTEEDRKQMLSEIGVKSFDELIGKVPAVLRNPAIDLPQGVSEFELKQYLENILSQNQTAREMLSFLGAGSYDHYIPSAVRHIISRGEFYTAYTPYQPEASQGTLQTIFEYQSMMAEITGLDVVNASHYDGATAFAEACLLALNFNQRQKVLVARSVHPEYRHVMKTYLSGTDFQIEEIPFNASGSLDMEAFRKMLDMNVGCVAVGSPNFFGLIEDLDEVSDLTHKHGALFVTTGHPLSYVAFRSPGEWKADVACGEAQPLGIPLSFGGPYVGYFSTARSLVRRIPGRLAGMTKDRNGRRTFVLTLQAREQHIRREKASSNICTNQALCALAVCVYLSTMGKEGLKNTALLNVERANSLRERIEKLSGYQIPFKGAIFNEFVVKSKRTVALLFEKLYKKGVLAGYSLEKDYPELKNHFLVTATETKTEEDLDHFVKLLGKI